MMLRRTTSVLFASLLLAGGVAASAHAAPAKPATHASRPAHIHRAAAKPVKHMMGRRAMSAGGDAQNSTVDQLNAQSLQRATTGTPAQ